MTDSLRSKTNVAIVFGRCRLFPHRRQLIVKDEIVSLGGRAFDMLLALIEAEGEILSLAELRKRVWGAGVTVEDHNVVVHISEIRKALGDDGEFVVNERSRGYRFTAEISRELVKRALGPVGAGPDGLGSEIETNLPAQLSPLVGREHELSALSELIGTERLVTLTGLGGIGKTKLAMEVARRALPLFSSGVWLAELVSVADRGVVEDVIATALGVRIGPNRTLAETLKVLSASRLLLVVDNCEHVIDAVAPLVETVLQAVPSLRMLVTSREALRVEGERVYHVSPLDVPSPDVVDVDALLECSAVQLFVERVRAIDARFVLSDETATSVAMICRRLEGIPLAIELAAGRVETLGVREVAKRLDDRLRLLANGRRTALDRHQTLRGTLDWSYRLLDEVEKALLARMGIFVNGFTLPAAASLFVEGDGGGIPVEDLLARLTRKSLVLADIHRETPRYHLLDTMRAYALEKLADGGESALAAARHANHYRELLEGVHDEWTAVPARELLARYAPEIDNVRAALEWSFGPDGELETGIALAAAAIPLWTLLSLLGECHHWSEHALMRVRERSVSPRHEMLLQAALGMSLLWAKGPVPETRMAWERSLVLAGELRELEYQARALYGLWVVHLRLGALRRALGFAEDLKFVGESAGSLSIILTGERIAGVSLQFLGEYARAQTALQRVIQTRRGGRDLHHSFVMRTGVDQRIAALACQARVYWVTGFPDRAWEMALVGVKEARTLGHSNSLCMALAEGACFVGTLRGDVAAVDEFTLTLTDYAEKYGFPLFRAFGKGFTAWVLINRGEVEEGWAELQSAIALAQGASVEVARANTVLVGVIVYGALVEIARRKGPIEDADRGIANALGWFRQNGGCWCAPELLRLEGELALAAAPGRSAKMAEKRFKESLSVARRDGAHSWELRAAISLARLLHNQNRAEEASVILRKSYNMFDEGFDTEDLRTAQKMVEMLSGSQIDTV